ncbi:MAG: recombinase family protein [Lachnospirales bacterium]
METKVKKIQVLSTKVQVENFKNSKKDKLKVCAYCRVSTDSEEQQTSYQSQVSFYKNKIDNNDDWKLVDIYADEGISGTSTKNRIAFNKMIKDCEDGKIDIVLTKSISRFSRNIVDCLTYIRKLKELGVKIIFEKENIDTLSENGELMLTILGGLAQEESASISNNIRWSMEKKFERGEVVVSGAMLGYKYNEHKNLEIVEEEAKIIRLIFKLFLEGESYKSIGEYLEENGYKTGHGKTTWRYNGIKHILQNEKYKGDAHLQKTYTRDFMDKNRKKNNGVIQAYYVEDSHPAIISKEDFLKVEQEIRRRSIKKSKNNKKANSKYALSDILICAECGSPYRRTTWKGQYAEPKYVWRCDNRLQHGKKFCKKSPTIEEKLIQKVLMEAIAELTAVERVEQIVNENKAKLQGSGKNDRSLDCEAKEKQELIDKQEFYKAKLDELILLELEGEDVTEDYKKVSKQLKEFKTKLEDLNKPQNVDNIKIRTTERIVNDFDESVVKQLINKVDIISKEKIEIEFVSALKMEMGLDKE